MFNTEKRSVPMASPCYNGVVPITTQCPRPTGAQVRVSRLSLAALMVAACMVAASPVLAGSICGTVRDAVTTQPIPQAAIFLFDSSDQYTGLYEDTDVNGQYCINDIPEGTYTLQVRVDNYLIATVSGIEVEDDPTGVDVDVQPRFALADPWPNPASSVVRFRFQAPSGSPVELDVFDVAGRRHYGWKGHASTLGEQSIEWNLRDFNGSELQSGIYFVRLRAAGDTAVRRFVRLR